MLRGSRVMRVVGAVTDRRTVTIQPRRTARILEFRSVRVATRDLLNSANEQRHGSAMVGER